MLSRSIVDLTSIEEPNTSSILTGAFNALNNGSVSGIDSMLNMNNRNRNMNMNKNKNINNRQQQRRCFNVNKNNVNKNKQVKDREKEERRRKAKLAHKLKISKSNAFTTGIVDKVSFNYDANRLKHKSFHRKFDEHFRKLLLEKTENSHSMDPYKKLSFKSRIIKTDDKKNNLSNDECKDDYSKYNLFKDIMISSANNGVNIGGVNSTYTKTIVYKLFNPKYLNGIRDVNLFRYVSENVLKLTCVGDVGIDILNFLHSLFIILYWNDMRFKLEFNESPMHGIVKMLRNLVPLQTCVWWLNLHHSLNMINQKQNLPNIDFKNILNKPQEKHIFYTNLIKRLMSSGEQQANTWKDYLKHSQTNLNNFLFEEKKRRYDSIKSSFYYDTNGKYKDYPFNKQLNNYLDQLLLPKIIIGTENFTNNVEKQLLISQSLSSQCLASRKKLLTDKTKSYFDHQYDDNNNSDHPSDDDDIILIGDNTHTQIIPNHTPKNQQQLNKPQPKLQQKLQQKPQPKPLKKPQKPQPKRQQIPQLLTPRPHQQIQTHQRQIQMQMQPKLSQISQLSQLNLSRLNLIHESLDKYSLLTQKANKDRKDGFKNHLKINHLWNKSSIQNAVNNQSKKNKTRTRTRKQEKRRLDSSESDHSDHSDHSDESSSTSSSSSSSDESTEDEDLKINLRSNRRSKPSSLLRPNRRKRKRSKTNSDSDSDPDFDPNEKQKEDRRGRPRKYKQYKQYKHTNDGYNNKKTRRKRQKLMHQRQEKMDKMEIKEKIENNGNREYEDDGVKVTLLDGKVPIDLNRKYIKKFLNCGICNNLLNGKIITLECGCSFCGNCLNEYFSKCEKESKNAMCPSCDCDLGQGTLNAIKRRSLEREDKVKSCMLDLVKKFNTT